MLDRYDPRDDDQRRADGLERDWGSRGGGERGERSDDDRSALVRHVDLPRGPEREQAHVYRAFTQWRTPFDDAVWE